MVELSQMNNEPISSVQSDQTSTHEDLVSTVRKHVRSTWRQPVAEHTRRAADTIIDLVEQHNAPLILDSFCGTGMSTAMLAELFPDALVVGIDKSQDRLAKHVVGKAENYRLIRANCEQTWAALAIAGVRCHRHYMLYPNPWPKRSHLKRRIHGHPAFPLLRTLGGTLQLRSNWLLYVEEFAKGLELLGYRNQISEIRSTDAFTLFERKYSANSENLWQCESIPVEDAGEDHHD